MAERIGAIRLIRSYGEEARESAAFRTQTDRYRKQVIRTQRFSSLTSPVTEVFSGFLVILIIWAATSPGLLGLGAPLAPATIIVFLMAALRLTSPLKTISGFPATMAIALAAAERIFEVLDEPPTEVDQPGEGEARFEREIVFDRVGFRYGDGDPVLGGISLTIPKGKVVALVGPSGAGKTTLADLLPRFHDPTEGRILLDGVPLTRLKRRSLRALMGVVSQDTVLLNDTVFANIAYGSPGATRERVEAAAEAANAAEFIAQLPQGFDTVLGERGTRLSRRTAPTDRDRPGAAARPADPDPRRGHQRARHRIGATGPAGHRSPDAGPHRAGDRPPARHRARCRRDPGAGRRADRRAGHPRRALRAGGLYRRLYDLQFRDGRCWSRSRIGGCDPASAR